MPHVPYLPPATRFFARIVKFECECPACGRLIVTSYDARDTPVKAMRMRAISHQRGMAEQRPDDPATQRLVWNPHTQRLRCPFCKKVLMIGLLAWDPPRTHIDQPRSSEPPEDVVPDRRQRLELRQAGGGWWAERQYVTGDPVNLRVTGACHCPRKGWVATCPVHGDPAQTAAQLAPIPAEGG